MQHLKQLESFVAVARAKSIREAAETTHLTSSALNRRILELESEVDSPLFERHARGISLTSAGEVFLDYARRTLREAETAHSQIDDLKGLRRGHIHLAVIAAMADGPLMEAIATFQGKHPKVQFSVTVAGSDEVVAAVVSQQADLGIAFNQSSEREFHELAERRHVLCAVMRSDHPLARRRSVSLNDCTASPLALPDSTWGGRRLLDEYLNRTGFRLTPHLVSNSYEVLVAFVRRTNGICFQIHPEKKGGKVAHDLVAVPVSETAQYARAMVLGALRGRVLPVAAARFSELARRTLFG